MRLIFCTQQSNFLAMGPTYSVQNSKWVWSGNATITNCKQTQGQEAPKASTCILFVRYSFVVHVFYKLKNVPGQFKDGSQLIGSDICAAALGVNPDLHEVTSSLVNFCYCISKKEKSSRLVKRHVYTVTCQFYYAHASSNDTKKILFTWAHIKL